MKKSEKFVLLRLVRAAVLERKKHGLTDNDALTLVKDVVFALTRDDVELAEDLVYEYCNEGAEK